MQQPACATSPSLSTSTTPSIPQNSTNCSKLQPATKLPTWLVQCTAPHNSNRASCHQKRGAVKHSPPGRCSAQHPASATSPPLSTSTTPSIPQNSTNCSKLQPATKLPTWLAQCTAPHNSNTASCHQNWALYTTPPTWLVQCAAPCLGHQALPVHLHHSHHHLSTPRNKLQQTAATNQTPSWRCRRCSAQHPTAATQHSFK
jgi:hypothetical protein